MSQKPTPRVHARVAAPEAAPKVISGQAPAVAEELSAGESETINESMAEAPANAAAAIEEVAS